MLQWLSQAAVEPIGGVVGGSGTPDLATLGFILGFAVMMTLDNALGPLCGS